MAIGIRALGKPRWGSHFGALVRKTHKDNEHGRGWAISAKSLAKGEASGS